MLKSVHKFYDEASGKHYYYNARTRRVTWSAPKLLSKLQRDISVAGGLDQEQQQEEHKVQRRRSKDHVWTDEEAAKCVQGLFRKRKARIAIFNMLKSIHKKYYDEASGKHYYYNSRTRRVTWSAPKLLSKLQRDISVAEDSISSSRKKKCSDVDLRITSGQMKRQQMRSGRRKKKARIAA